MNLSTRPLLAFTQLLRAPYDFFRQLQLESAQLPIPLAALGCMWLLSNVIPLIVGQLEQRSLLASLIYTGFGVLVFMGTTFLLAPKVRVLEVLGWTVLPLLLGMLLVLAFWFLGSLARNIASVLMLSALWLTWHRLWIGLYVLSGSSVVAWRTVLILPIVTIVMVGIVFGLLVRWLGLA